MNSPAIQLALLRNAHLLSPQRDSRSRHVYIETSRRIEWQYRVALRRWLAEAVVVASQSEQIKQTSEHSSTISPGSKCLVRDISLCPTHRTLLVVGNSYKKPTHQPHNHKQDKSHTISPESTCLARRTCLCPTHHTPVGRSYKRRAQQSVTYQAHKRQTTVTISQQSKCWVRHICPWPTHRMTEVASRRCHNGHQRSTTTNIRTIPFLGDPSVRCEALVFGRRIARWWLSLLAEATSEPICNTNTHTHTHTHTRQVVPFLSDPSVGRNALVLRRRIARRWLQADATRTHASQS
jgi:hypothetical protein